MYIKEEISLKNFEFWSGARENAKQLTDDEMDKLEKILEEDASCGEFMYTDTQINDLFWFDFDFVCELLGITDEEIRERGNRR